MCGLVILHPTEKDAEAAKTIRFMNGLWIKTSDYKLGSTFSVIEVDNINDIDELSDYVKLAAEHGSTLVRGELTAQAKGTIKDGRSPDWLNRRLDKRNANDQPSLRECDRLWLMLDIDGWRIPGHLNLFDIEDHEAIIDAVIRDLCPVCFWNVRSFYQFSSSCGTAAAADTLKVHIFFWLSKAHSNADLRAIFKVHIPRIDPKVLTGNQPHFVANPTLIGRSDPLPTRYGWHDGLEDEVVLPDVPPTPKYVPSATPHSTADGSGGNWLDQWLIKMGDGPGLDGYYAVIRSILWDYSFRFVRGGVTQNDQALAEIIRNAVKTAPKFDTRDMSIVEECYLNPVWLQREITKALKKRAATETQTEKAARLLREAMTAMKEHTAAKRLTNT